MKECWSEGELRAYIDRELPTEEMQRMAAHLEGCSECGDLWAELAGRAARVSALLDELPAPGVAASVRWMPLRGRNTRRWIGAAAALAAGLAAGIVALPKRPPTPAATPLASSSATAARGESNRGESSAGQAVAAVSQAPAGATPVVSLAANRPSRSGAGKRTGRPPAVQAQGSEPFLALDNEPIEDGMVWRVELGPRQVPADVIIGSDGRPRAIRLVNLKSNR